jgi:hypothetical protein
MRLNVLTLIWNSKFITEKPFDRVNSAIIKLFTHEIDLLLNTSLSHEIWVEEPKLVYQYLLSSSEVLIIAIINQKYTLKKSLKLRNMWNYFIKNRFNFKNYKFLIIFDKLKNFLNWFL